jgi:ABC-type uncharacterized transport system ATPase subunit
MSAQGIGSSIIEADHLSKNYGEVRAVDDVSFAVAEGEILGLLGHNGAGRQLFGYEWLSVAIILGWAVVGYGLVWWRLSVKQAA